MAEALRATNEFVFREMRLHRIMANYRPENVRSGKLLERLGFVREGLAKDYLFIDGAWRDHILTALVNPRFDTGWVEAAGQA
jgi:ribosomal-protein-alanine N-acetyltransferase